MSYFASFTGNGRSCTNINECEIHCEESESRHRCDSNAQCTDSPGSYSCTCIAGFSGDGVDCDGRWNIGNTNWKNSISINWLLLTI